MRLYIYYPLRVTAPSLYMSHLEDILLHILFWACMMDTD